MGAAFAGRNDATASSSQVAEKSISYVVAFRWALVGMGDMRVEQKEKRVKEALACRWIHGADSMYRNSFFSFDCRLWRGR